MKRNFTVCIIIATALLIWKPVLAADRDNCLAPAPDFLSFCNKTFPLLQPAKLISFKASMVRKKILLQWVISENETTDQFELEKSADGKNFEMAALIFGTDKPQTDSYTFFDKLKDGKISYRLKIIGKDKKIEYSDILVFKSK